MAPAAFTLSPGLIRVSTNPSRLPSSELGQLGPGSRLSAFKQAEGGLGSPSGSTHYPRKARANSWRRFSDRSTVWTGGPTWLLYVRLGCRRSALRPGT